MEKKASFMELAFEQAELAMGRGEVPVGAVVVMDGEVIAADGNRTLELKDPTAHAEVQVIRAACQSINSERLPEADLYVTLEPCPICAGSISAARIRRLYFGASDPKSGAVDNGVQLFSNPTCHHKPEVYSGIMERECSEIIRKFFAKRRT